MTENAAPTTLHPHDLYKLDYEKSLEILGNLHEERLSYQKFYIGLLGGCLSISVLFARFSMGPSSAIAVHGKNLSVEMLLGILFCFSAIVGLMIVRHLVSVRILEVYFGNTIIFLRSRLIAELAIPAGYPVLRGISCTSRLSADYFGIAVASVLNFCFLILGAMLLFGDQTGAHASWFISTLLGGGYLAVHITCIERPLATGDRLWKPKLPKTESDED